MKKVSILFVIFILAATLLIYPIAVSMWIPVGIRVGYFLCWFLAFWANIFLSRKLLDKRMLRLEKQLGSRCLHIYTASLLDEFYLLDMEKCQLIGLFGLNPFRFQYLDAGLIDDVEIIVRGLHKNVVDAIVCRIHFEGRTYDIYLHRYNKLTLYVGTKEEKELMDYADKIKNSLLKAGQMSKKKGGRQNTAAV